MNMPKTTYLARVSVLSEFIDMIGMNVMGK